MRVPNKLGKRQLGCLEMMLSRNGEEWSDGAGWHWGSLSETDRILKALCNIGPKEKPLVTRLGTTTSGYGTYKLTNRALAITYVGGRFRNDN